MPAPTEDAQLLEEEIDELGGLVFSRPPMKHSDTRDSISSTDSDISISYDKDAERAPLTSADEGAHLADMSDCGSETGSTNGKDSGCEVAEQEPPFIPPDEELATRIVTQVEFYFSDVNITKDAFLLKHVKRNKEGYVSLKLISSFKRVKHLAKDWRVVASALSRSSKLQINDVGTKLRRTDPLPQYDETTPSRTVVAAHLPHDKPTIEHVADLFSCFGDIALIRILRPGNPVPADVRNFVAKRPELNGVVCALVEFERAESAREAVSGKPDWKGFSQGLRVIELAATPERKKRTAQTKKTAAARLQQDLEYSSSCYSGSEAETEFRPRARYSPASRQSENNNKLSQQSNNNNRYNQQPPTTPVKQLPSTPAHLRLTHRASEPNCSPWLQRRISSGSDSGGSFNMGRRVSSGSESGSSTPSRPRSSSVIQLTTRPRSNSGVSHLPDNVVRMPRGPDGTKGFHDVFQNRMRSVSMC